MRMGSMLFPSPGLMSLGRPQHFLGTKEFSLFSGLLSAWFVKYKDNSLCTSLTYCTQEVASLNVFEL